MSQARVDLVLRVFDAWNRGDREAWLAAATPDTEWSSAVLREMEGAESVHTGRDELGRFWDEWHSLWNLELQILETRDLGDTVLVFAQMRTKGKASGAEAERTVGYVVEFEEGALRRVRAYLSPEEAAEAAGLQE